MRSKRRVEPLDTIETDVPMTAEDHAAQWRVRDGRPMTSKEYLDWCTWLTRDEVAPCRDRHTERFEL